MASISNDDDLVQVTLFQFVTIQYRTVYVYLTKKSFVGCRTTKTGNNSYSLCGHDYLNSTVSNDVRLNVCNERKRLMEVDFVINP